MITPSHVIPPKSEAALQQCLACRETVIGHVTQPSGKLLVVVDDCNVMMHSARGSKPSSTIVCCVVLILAHDPRVDPHLQSIHRNLPENSAVIGAFIRRILGYIKSLYF